MATAATATANGGSGNSSNGSGKKVPIKIEITSDTICPFCYLGYKKILAATEQATKEGLPVDFSISFKPFILDPTLPVDHAVSKKERYAAKFGNRSDAIIAGMAERGKPWGINFNYNGVIRATFLSHRLLEKAKEIGGGNLQREVAEELFEGYFEREKDVGDRQWLAEVAVRSSLFDTEEEALEFLDSDELKLQVCNDVHKAQALGISGVPFSVINDRYAVSGAQEPEAFLEIFRKISKGVCPAKKSTTFTQEGEVCT